MPLRANDVKIGSISKLLRPGLAEPTLQSAAFKNQVNVNSPKRSYAIYQRSNNKFAFRTLAGDVPVHQNRLGNWVIGVQRPGLAGAVITPKSDQYVKGLVAAKLAQVQDHAWRHGRRSGR